MAAKVDDLASQLGRSTIATSGVSFEGKSLKLNNAEDAKELVEAIKECKDLHYLNLAGNTLGVEAAKEVGKALESHKEFKRALWKDLFTGRLKTEIPQALQYLGAGLVLAEARLTELDMSDNAFGPIGVEGLAVLLRSSACYNLQELRLNNNGLGIGGGKLLAKALLDCHKDSSAKGQPLALKVFIAGRNRLENDGAKALAQVFQTLGSLQEVAMPQNGIYHVGVSAIANALTHCPQLRELNLNDNTVTWKGCEALAQALPKLPLLKVINLGDCLLKTKGAIILNLALTGSHQHLEELTLSFNEIGEKAASSLVDAVKGKPNFKQLIVDGNQFGEDGREVLKSGLEVLGLGDVLGSLEEDEDDGESEEDKSSEEEESGSDTEESAPSTPASKPTPKTAAPVSNNLFGTTQPAATFGAPPTFGALPNNTVSFATIFGAPTTTTAAFGTSTTAVTATGGIFGASNTTAVAFGTPTTAVTFGGTSIFGGTTTKSPATVFGTPTTAVTFGTPQNTVTFGTPTTAVTFGTPQNTVTFGTPTTSVMFGSPQQTTTLTFGTPKSGPSIFGNTTLNTANTGASVFGTPTSTVFGTPKSPSIFGNLPSGVTITPVKTPVITVPESPELLPGQIITMGDFLKDPSANRLMALGTDRYQKIMDEFQKFPPEEILSGGVRLLMSVSTAASTNKEDIRAAACEAGVALYTKMFKWAEAEDKLSMLNNAILVNLQLIKTEEKNHYADVPWDLHGCMIVLEQVCQQKLLPYSTKDTLQIFLGRPKIRADAYPEAKRKLMAALNKYQN